MVRSSLLRRHRRLFVWRVRWSEFVRQSRSQIDYIIASLIAQLLQSIQLSFELNQLTASIPQSASITDFFSQYFFEFSNFPCIFWICRILARLFAFTGNWSILDWQRKSVFCADCTFMIKNKSTHANKFKLERKSLNWLWNKEFERFEDVSFIWNLSACH